MLGAVASRQKLTAVANLDPYTPIAMSLPCALTDHDRPDSDRLRHIAGNIPGMIYEFVQYPDGRMAFPYASQGLVDLYGISPEAIREDATPLFAAVHVDDLADLRQSVQDSATHLTPWSCEYRIYHQDGRLRWVQGDATPQRRPDGSIHWYGYVRDVTTQKTSQLALEASQQKLRRVIDTINGLVFIIAPDLTLSFLNPAVATATGYALEALLHRSVADVTHPDDLAQVVQQVQACLAGGSCRALEFRALHQNGQYYWYSANLSPFVSEIGGAIACLVIATHIDDRKQAELALQESETRYQSLVANVPGMIYRYLPHDDGGVFTYVSAGCRELFGIEPEQLQQDPNRLRALMNPDDLLSLQASIAQAVERGTDWAWEGWVNPVAGQPRWIQGRSRPQLTDDGLVWDGLLIDITALKQAEADLSHEVGYRRALFEASGDGIVVLGSSGQVLEANHSFAAMLGYSLEDALGLTVADFDVELNGDLAAVEDGRALTELYLDRFERRHRRQDGSTYAVEISASAVQWHGQSVHLCVCRDIEARQRAERALAASEDRFQQLAAASPGVLYTVVESPTGIVRFDYISPAAAEIHEIPVATLMKNGALISDQIHPEDRAQYLATTTASIESRTPFTCEWRIITPSGKTKWLKAHSCPEQRPNGEIAWHGIVIEITAQKQAEREITTLQTALLEAQEIAHIGNWAFDLASQRITWSPELFRMFGLDSALGEPSYDVYLQLIHPDDRPLMVQAVQQAVSQGTPYQIDYRALLADGQVRYHEGRGKVDRDGAGEITRLFGTCLDITDRKQTELALRDHQLQLQLALDSSGTGTWDWNLRTNEIVYSRLFWEIFGGTPGEKNGGYGADEIRGKKTVVEWSDRIHPEDHAQLEADIARHMRGETEIYENVHRFHCQDGTYKWGLAQGRIAEWDDAGQPIRFIGIYRDINNRKNAEIALKDLQKKLEKAQEIAHLGYWSFDIATQKITWSDEIFYMFGMTPDQGEPSFIQHLEQIHPDDRSSFLERVAEANQGIPQNFDARILQPDGTIRYINNRLDLEYEGEQVVRMFGVILDITERKQSELALQLSEARFRAIFEQAAAGINQADASGRFIRANQYFCNLLGYTQAELLQLRWQDIAHSEDLLQREMSLLFSGEIDSLTKEQRYRHKKGHWVWTEVTISLIRDSAGQVIADLAIVLDVSELRQANIALQKSEASLRAIFDQAAAGINQIDVSGHFIEVNQSYCDLLGYTKAELLERSFEELIHPEDLARHQAQIDQVMNGEIDYLDYEKRDRHKNGNWIWNRISISTLRDEAGQLLGNLAVVVDIRDRKQAEHIIRQQATRETLLREITQRIRQSLDLPTIFNTACQEIRLAFLADRVGIFKFDPNSGCDRGEFVAEAYRYGLPSVLGVSVSDHCFGANFAALYAQGHYFVINDIAQADTTDCHTDMLTRFQVRANLVLPVICGRELWGLLCIHQCSEPRHWLQSDIELGQQLANQLGIALQQALLYQQLQTELCVRQQAEAQISQQLYQQTALGGILQQIRESLDLQELLSIIIRQVQTIFQCDRVIVLQVFGNGRSQIVEEAVLEPFPALKAMQWEDEVWSKDILDFYWQGQPRIVPDVMDDIWTDCLVDYSQAGQIQSKVVAPILQEVRTETGDRWFAPDNRHKIWGVLVIQACQTQRVWQETEAQLLQQIANQLAIAIQQITIFEQLQQELGERQRTQQQLAERNQELAIANQDLSRATRLKDEFLANMSHELRTPLNVILGFAQLLNSDTTLQTQHREYIRIMQRSGDHLLHLINDILDLSKIEADRITLEPASIDLISLLWDLQAMFQEQAADKNLTFTLDLKPDLPRYIMADPNKLRQVLINLLGNAVKFTQVGGIVLRVGLAPSPETSPGAEGHQPQARLAFAIEDTGIGIAPDELSTIFDAFIQAKAGKLSLGGTGLGLAICRRLVRLMGGDLTVTSTLNQGSIFRFALPLQVAQGADVAPEDDLSLVTGLTPGQPDYRILVVDDQPENRYFIMMALSQIGFTVDVAQNGVEAVARCQQWHPQLIWMDLRMPEMDGYEATRRIRADAAARGEGLGPVIIALTAQVSSDLHHEALTAGCDDVMSKPVQIPQLLAKMSDHLGLSYRYGSPEPPSPAPKPPSVRLESRALQVMPSPWIHNLHRAAVLCDGDAVAQLIQQVPSEHSALSDSLNLLLQDFKFEVLMQLAQPQDPTPG